MYLETPPLRRFKLRQRMGHFPAEHRLKIRRNMHSGNFAGTDRFRTVRSQQKQTRNRRHVHGTRSQKPAQLLQFAHIPAVLRHDERRSVVQFLHQLEILREGSFRNIAVGIHRTAGIKSVAEMRTDAPQNMNAFRINAAADTPHGIFRQTAAGKSQYIAEPFGGCMSQ